MMWFKLFIWERATTRVAPYYIVRRIVGCDPCGRPLEMDKLLSITK